MKIVDVNVLLYVVNRDALQHEKALKWWEAAIAQQEAIGIPWHSLLGFLRIVTLPRLTPRPMTVIEATQKVATWLDLPNVVILQESESHWTVFRQLLEELGTAGNLTNDLHLAALAISQGATLVSCDSDFARIRHLRWENPLA
jgi:hypothetical protein